MEMVCRQLRIELEMFAVGASCFRPKTSEV
jgi:hypothetical protein